MINIRFLIEDYRVEMFDGFNYGTRMIAEYETDSIPALENYVFVQYIKGCAYLSKKNGEVDPSFVQWGSFSNTEPLRYLDWTVESHDGYPVYYSYPNMPRNYFYLWNKSNNPFDNDNDQHYGKNKPPTPKLYVRDRPGTAFYVENTGWAKNTSLQLRMCLYKTADVPPIVQDKQILVEPIFCYQWSSSFVFNHEMKKFENPYGISEVCK